MIPYIVKYLMANKNIVKVVAIRLVKDIILKKPFNFIKTIVKNL